MTGDEVRRLQQRYVEMINDGDAAAADDLIAPDYVDPAAAPDDPPGPAGFKRLLGRVKSAFPDFHVTIDDELLTERDGIVVRFHWEGTHRGPFLGIEPTGRRVRVAGICVDRWEAGKLVEEWELTDRAGLVEQLTGPAD